MDNIIWWNAQQFTPLPILCEFVLIRIKNKCVINQFCTNKIRWFYLICYFRWQRHLQRATHIVLCFSIDFFVLVFDDLNGGTHGRGNSFFNFKLLLMVRRIYSNINSRHTFTKHPIPGIVHIFFSHSPLAGLARFGWPTRTPSANPFDTTNMHNAQMVVALECHLTAIIIPFFFFFPFSLQINLCFLFVYIFFLSVATKHPANISAVFLLFYNFWSLRTSKNSCLFV